MHSPVSPDLPSTLRPVLRVLAVDDNPANVRLVYEILGREYEVFAAASGQAALDFCVATPPDLVLLDVVMGGMDGLETCRRLRADPRTCDIPVIFVTGGTIEVDEEACWAAGGVDFVAKPVSATTLRNRVRVHLTLKQQADLLRQMAFIDGLTGLHNRRYFDAQLTAEWRRARRNNTPVSVLMIDLDFFKQFNDRYGHPAGDLCLRQLGQILMEVVSRSADLCARYGGEEFVCLLPETDLDGAMQLAQRIINALAGRRLVHEGSRASAYVTASVGAATCYVGALDQAAQLLQLADQMLYRAKAEGRAQAVGSAMPLTVSPQADQSINPAPG